MLFCNQLWPHVWSKRTSWWSVVVSVCSSGVRDRVASSVTLPPKKVVAQVVAGCLWRPLSLRAAPRDQGGR